MDKFHRDQLDEALDDLFAAQPPLPDDKIEEEILDMTGSWNPVTPKQVLDYIRPRIQQRAA